MAPLSERPSRLTVPCIILKTAGISHADLASKIGTTRQWVHDVLSGRVRPSPALVGEVPILLADWPTADPNEPRGIFLAEQLEPRLSVLDLRVSQPATA